MLITAQQQQDFAKAQADAAAFSGGGAAPAAPGGAHRRRVSRHRYQCRAIRSTKWSKAFTRDRPTNAATVASNIGRALNIGPDDPVPADQRDVAQRYVQSYAERTGTRAPGLQHGAEIAQQTQLAEQRYGVSSDLLQRQIQQESGGNPASTSPIGAAGVSQFMPQTAKQYGVDVRSIPSSVDGQARYMKDLLTRYNGNEGLALAAYNWGEGNVGSLAQWRPRPAA